MRRMLVLLMMVTLLCFVGAVAATPMTVAASLPFVWIRSAPSSSATAVYTLYPSYHAVVETTGNTAWDGYQSWTEVYLIANAGVRGWVEQGSLVTMVAPVSDVQPQTPYWPHGTSWGQPQYLVPYWPQPYIPPGYYQQPGWYQPYPGDYRGRDWGDAQG